MMKKHNYPFRNQMSGASLVEFVIVGPVLLFMMLGTVQAAMVFHAKSNLNYAAYEAARAGSTGHAQLNTIRASFTNAMTGYYGGGRNPKEVAKALARAQADINTATLQVELLSPTSRSFDDFASPRLKKRYKTEGRVIPNNNLSALKCPMDRQCNSNPASNASGQTMSDANILKLRITYGIPPRMQMPLVGRFYVAALKGLSGKDNETSTLHGLNKDVKSPINQDVFIEGLLNQNRIPVVVHTAMRMQSDIFEDENILGGPGNNGNPTEPTDEPPVYSEPSPDDGGAGPTDPGGGNSDVCGGSSQVPLYTPVSGTTLPVGGNQNASKLPSIVGEFLKKG